MLTAQDSLEKQTPRTNLPSNRGSKWAQDLIVEFVGPPGCGKTTNCNHFSILFNESGIRTYVFKDVKEFLYGLGIRQRIHLYACTLLYNSVKLISYIFLLASNGVYSLDSIKRYVKLCIFNAAVHKFLRTRRVDVLLLDQWIIQGLWSATIFKARSYLPLQQKLPDFYLPASYVLYFDVDEETASGRIEARSSDRSRFDRMDPGRRLAEMKRYSGYLRNLYENSGCCNKLTFSAKISPRANAQAFLKQLQSRSQTGN